MCGIFCYFSRTERRSQSEISRSANRISHRGPDITKSLIGKVGQGGTYYFIFHRLAVNGLTPEADQPITKDGCYLLCNGEIYNYKELVEKYDIRDYRSGSDCEIILHLYGLLCRGVIGSLKEMVSELRGEFAFTIFDLVKNRIIIGRDPLGIRSMYYSDDADGLGICSELKGLYDIADHEAIRQFPAGCYAELLDGGNLTITRYYDIYENSSLIEADEEEVITRLQELLTMSVKRRLMCDRRTEDGAPVIGAFLSGGFDSSMIAGLLTKYYPGKLHTFSIGFAGAPDLVAAAKVAEYIGSVHHEVIVTEDEMMGVLERTPRTIESYDVTTNRASAFMLRLSEYVRDNTDIIVIYSGEVSDELFGSYLYFHRAPDPASFHEETLRLMKDLQYFDLLRGDKSSAAAGLEIRVPLADVDLLDYAKKISPGLKLRGIEKYIVREAVSRMEIIPKDICWRVKEAMSDGVSLENRSWSVIIQDFCSRTLNISDPIEAERQWIMTKFKEAYSGCERTIPYYWLPKWCGDTKEASARKWNLDPSMPTA